MLREVRTCPGAGVENASCRDRRLIQPTTVGPPAILTDTRPCAARVRARFRRGPSEPRVRAMTVIVPLEIKELHLEISGRPEEGAVETFAPNRSDQAFDEWMRERHVRHRLDRFHVEDSQIRLPLVEPIQGIMVRAEVCRRGVAARRSIEHPAQPHAIHDAAVHAKAHDAPRTLVHHDEHPVRAEYSRFASKQVKTPQAVLRVTKDREPGRSRRVWLRLVPSRENAPHHILVDGNTEGQGHLLRDPWTPPSWVPLFHVDDGGHDFLSGSLGARLLPYLGREQPAIFPLRQRPMEAQERGGFQNDRGTDQSARAHEERTHTGDHAINEEETGGTTPGTIEDEQLLLDEHRFGDHGTHTAGTGE